jgi:DNA (cytosine-5)-methyltransferase 1
MTYFPRVCKKPKGVIMDGSIAILIPKYDFVLTQEDMLFFSSDEFRSFYCIARNKQRRSLNIDEDSVFWFGRKERKKNDGAIHH